MVQITKCIDCSELKDKFTKGSCKQCYQRKYRESNKERINEQKRKYNQRPEVKEHIKKHSKEYHQRPEVKEHSKKWREDNKEQIRERMKIYSQRPEAKELARKRRQKPEAKERIKEYQESNKEHLKKYRKGYYQRPGNKKHHNEYCSKYQKDNYYTSEGKKRRRRGMLKRTERINKIEHNFSFYDWWEKVLETKGVCPECKENVGVYKLTMDHIMPVSKAPEGFIYTLEGVKPLCKPCNSSKGSSDDEYDLIPGAADTTLKEPEGISEILERIGGPKNDNIQML